jgi:hypothetical protein
LRWQLLAHEFLKEGIALVVLCDVLQSQALQGLRPGAFLEKVSEHRVRAPGAYTRPLFSSTQAHFVGYVVCNISPQSIRRWATGRSDQNGLGCAEKWTSVSPCRAQREVEAGLDVGALGQFVEQRLDLLLGEVGRALQLALDVAAPVEFESKV